MEWPPVLSIPSLPHSPVCHPHLPSSVSLYTLLNQYNFVSFDTHVHSTSLKYIPFIMRYSFVSAAVLALASSVFGQGFFDSITSPTRDQVLPLGQPFDIIWAPEGVTGTI